MKMDLQSGTTNHSGFYPCHQDIFQKMQGITAMLSRMIPRVK